MFKTINLKYLIALSCLTTLCATLLLADTWNTPPTPFSVVDSNSSDLATNPEGNAIAIWSNQSTSTVEVSYFSNNAFGSPEILDSLFSTIGTKVAMDQTGTGLAIWCRPFTGEIKTAYFNGLNWITPLPDPLDTLITFFPANASTSIAMDGNGNGIALWIDPDVSAVRSSTFTAGSWSAPVTIGTGTENTSVAFSSNGTAVAIWSNAGDVQVNNYNGALWGVSQSIGSNSSPYQMEVGIDSNGNAIASFLDALYNVSLSYYNGSIWSPSQIISTAPGNIDLSLAMAENGTAVLAWVDSGNVGLSSTFNGSMWSAPFSFAINVITPTNDAFPSTSISVALDTSGNALITWGTTSFEIRSERLIAGTNVWIDNSFVAAFSNEGLSDINAGLADNGRGFSVWQNRFNTEDIQVFGSFTLFLIPTPPTSIQGRTCNNKFASQTDRVHIITWTPSTDPLTVSYNIRRNGVLIANVPLTGPFIYLDHNRCKRPADTYAVTAVGPTGLESEPLIVILR